MSEDSLRMLGTNHDVVENIPMAYSLNPVLMNELKLENISRARGWRNDGEHIAWAGSDRRPDSKKIVTRPKPGRSAIVFARSTSSTTLRICCRRPLFS